jgi:hypothetical protein
MLLTQKQKVDQWNGIKDPGINEHRYSHLIFDKGAQNLHCQKIVSSTNSVGKTGYPHVED